MPRLFWLFDNNMGDMHIILDIRSQHSEWLYISQYAQSWAKKWRNFSPNDTITFLIFDTQEAPENELFIRVPAGSWFTPKYQFFSKNKNEIFRCINFSRYTPYDPSVPTITHIFDMWMWFYDSEINANILKRKEREFKIKRLLKKSSHFVVPSFSTGMELVELWNIHEKYIDVVPLFAMESQDITTKTPLLDFLPEKFFLFDATFGIESNLEKMILAFSYYVKNGGDVHLVLHGDSHKYLKKLTDIITRENLQKYIHITGMLPLYEREFLYKNARAWIFLGAYNTTKTNLSLAKTYHLPLILSDIPAFSLYKNAYKIHPNHIDELSPVILEEKFFEKNNEDEVMESEENILQKYKILLSENKKNSKKFWNWF